MELCEPVVAVHRVSAAPGEASQEALYSSTHSAVNLWSQCDALPPPPPHHIHDRFDETHRPAHGSTLPQKKNRGHQNDRQPQRATHATNSNVQRGETENPPKEMDSNGPITEEHAGSFSAHSGKLLPDRVV